MKEISDPKSGLEDESETPELNEEAYLVSYFSYGHLPHELQVVSRRFAELAREILALPAVPERTVALRKLLEAKDCAVRSARGRLHYE